MNEEARFHFLDKLYKLEDENLVKGNIAPISLNNISKGYKKKQFYEVIQELIKEKKVYLILPEDYPYEDIFDNPHDWLDLWSESILIQSQTFEILNLLQNFRIPNRENNVNTFKKINKTIRYRRTYKYLPKREVLVDDFKEELEKEIIDGICFNSKKYRCKIKDRVRLAKLGEAIELVCKALKNKYGGLFKFSNFQSKGIKAKFYSKFFEDLEGYPFPKKHYIITGGVGTGKTLIYIVPILIEIIFLKKSSNNPPDFNTIIFFPRVTLSIEQYEEIESLIWNILDTTFVSVLIDAGGKLKEIAGMEISSPNLSQAIEYCYKDYSYDILITNIETFKNRINHPVIASILAKNIKNVIFDEVHLISGKKGKHILYLFKRLKVMITSAYEDNKKSISHLSFSGISATIENPKSHLKKLFSIKDCITIDHIYPDEGKLKESGHIHHIFLRNEEEVYKNNLDLIARLSSLIIHNRRNKITLKINTPFGPNIKNYQKSIVFIDSTVGVSKVRNKIHEQEFPKNKLAYFSVCTTPLLNSRLYIKLKQDFRNKLEVEERINKIENICKRCKHGKRKQKFSFTVDDLNLDENSYFQLRFKKRKYYTINEIKTSDYLNKEKDEIFLGNSDFCPYYKEKICWHLSEDSHELEFDEDFNYGIKAKSLSAETKNIRNIKSSNDFFLISEDDLFKNNRKRYVFLDLLITTPVIEVGLNISNLNEGIGTNFIRNFAAYYQKVGRIGREIFSDSIFLTILSDKKLENYFSHVFTNKDQESKQIKNPVYLKVENEYFEKTHVFNAILDYFSLNKEAYALNLYYIDKFDYQEIIKLFVDSELNLLRNYLSKITANFQIIEEAINKFKQVLIGLSFRTRNISIAEMIFDKRKINSLTEEQKKRRIIKDINDYYKNFNSMKIRYFYQIFQIDYFKKLAPFTFPSTYFLQDTADSIRIYYWKTLLDFQNKKNLLKMYEEYDFQAFMRKFIPTLLSEKLVENTQLNFSVSGPLEEIFFIQEKAIRYLKLDLNKIIELVEFKTYDNLLDFNPIKIHSFGGHKRIEQLSLFIPKAINLFSLGTKRIHVTTNTLQIIENNEVSKDNKEIIKQSGHIEEINFSSIKTIPIIIKKWLKKDFKEDSKTIKIRNDNLFSSINFIGNVRILEATIGTMRRSYQYEREIPIFFFDEIKTDAENYKSFHSGIGRILKTEGIKISFNHDLIKKYIQWKEKQGTFNDAFKFHLFYLSLLDSFYEYHSLYYIYRYFDSSLNKLKEIIFSEWKKIKDPIYNEIPLSNKIEIILSKIVNSLPDWKLNKIQEDKISKFFSSEIFKDFSNDLMECRETTWQKAIILSLGSVFLQKIKEISGMDEDEVGVEFFFEKNKYKLIFYDNEQFGNGICEKVFNVIKTNDNFYQEFDDVLQLLMTHHKLQKEKKEGLNYEFIDLLYIKENKLVKNLNDSEKDIIEKIYCIINCIDCIYDETIFQFNNVSKDLLNIFLLSDFIDWFLMR